MMSSMKRNLLPPDRWFQWVSSGCDQTHGPQVSLRICYYLSWYPLTITDSLYRYVTLVHMDTIIYLLLQNIGLPSETDGIFLSIDFSDLFFAPNTATRRSSPTFVHFVARFAIDVLSRDSF